LQLYFLTIYTTFKSNTRQKTSPKKNNPYKHQTSFPALYPQASYPYFLAKNVLFSAFSKSHRAFWKCLILKLQAAWTYSRMLRSGALLARLKFLETFAVHSLS
jgi:hypothetical protein